MKHYGAMRFVAGLLKFLGWLTIAVGGLVIVVVLNGSKNIPSSSYVDPAMVFLVALVIGGLIIITGVFWIAAGEMVSAIADIATNSAHLPKIAENSDRTVGFFEHISTRSNAQAPAAAPSQAL
jgi:hypothetical protein